MTSAIHTPSAEPDSTPASLSHLYGWLALKTISDISSSVISIVLATYVYSLTGSATVLGLVLALQLLGAVIGGAVAPQLLQRTQLSRRDLIFIGELCSGIAIGILAVAPTAWQVWLIYFIPSCLGLFQGILRVAMMAEIPALVGQAGRHHLNALLSATDGLAVVIGSIIAAFITQYLAFSTVFLLDALSFFFSAIGFLILRRGMPLQEAAADNNEARAHPPAMLKLIPSIVFMIIAARFVEAFGSSTHNVGFALKSRLFDGTSPAYLYGWIMAAWGVGRLLAAALAPKLLQHKEHQQQALEPFFIQMLILTFGAFLAIFYAQSFGLILVLALLAGLFDAATETTYYSVLQNADSAVRTTTISLSYMVERAGLGIGMVLVGWCFSARGITPTALLFYGSSILMAMLALLLVWRALRSQSLRGN